MIRNGCLRLLGFIQPVAVPRLFYLMHHHCHIALAVMIVDNVLLAGKEKVVECTTSIIETQSNFGIVAKSFETFLFYGLRIKRVENLDFFCECCPQAQSTQIVSNFLVLVVRIKVSLSLSRKEKLSSSCTALSSGSILLPLLCVHLTQAVCHSKPNCNLDRSDKYA